MPAPPTSWTSASSRALFGADPTAAAANFDDFFLKGKVPLWNQMGHGNWATDPNYASKVLRVYHETQREGRGSATVRGAT